MSVFASRYARAFADVVTSAKLDPAKVDKQLADFEGTWQGSTELREVFENPSFLLEKKIAILDKICEKLGAEKVVRNFLAVLISHDRISSVEEILAAYRVEIDRRTGVSEVRVVSARKLEAPERKALQEQIARLAGSKVSAHYEVDDSLLGGAIVRIGSTVYDGSVRGQLDRLKEQLVAG
jgi:F-type H+-transporting ATPase subunit delta